jgi:hypothetical protein
MLNGTLTAQGGLDLPHDGRSWQRVSRRVGVLTSVGIGGQGSRWSTSRLNELMGLHRPVGRCGRVVSSAAGG